MEQRISECGRLFGRPSRGLIDLFSLYSSLDDVKTSLLSKLERSLCFFRIFLEMFLWFVRSKNKLWSTHLKNMTGFFFQECKRQSDFCFALREPVRTTDKLQKSSSDLWDFFFFWCVFKFEDIFLPIYSSVLHSLYSLSFSPLRVKVTRNICSLGQLGSFNWSLFSLERGILMK